MAESPAATPDIVSFLVHESGQILSLTKIDGEEDTLLKRVDGEWVEVPEDDRSVFDRTMLDVEQEEIGNAIEKFDSQPDDLTKEDVAQFLSPA